MWTEQILDSADKAIDGVPGFPPAGVQERFVGRSGRTALEEVVPFVGIINEYASPVSDTQILDLGVGWGRIARFFQGTVDPSSLFLADVDPEALKWCADCRVQGTPTLLDPYGALPMAGNSLDVVYSYSVFSHLSEQSAVHWLNEIARTLKPGGLFVFTTQSLRFLNTVYACSRKWRPTDFERSMGAYMGPQPKKSIARYKSGLHTYSDVNGGGGGGILDGEFYGWAAIPPAWFSQNFGHEFMVERYIDDPNLFEQAVYITRKR